MSAKEIFQFYAGRMDFGRGIQYNMNQYKMLKSDLARLDVYLNEISEEDLNTLLQQVKKFDSSPVITITNFLKRQLNEMQILQ